jgi:hypothetical protein
MEDSLFFNQSVMNYNAFKDVIAELVQIALRKGLESGTSLTGDDIMHASSWQKILDSVNIVAPGCKNSWPDLFLHDSIASALVSKQYPLILDALYCGQSWRAQTTPDFDWHNH